MEVLAMMTDLWDESADEDKQQIARMMFEEIVYDLDRLEIVDFRLKPWAERFLILRAQLYDDDPTGVRNQGLVREKKIRMHRVKTCIRRCPIGASEARTAPRLEDGRISVPAALSQLYHERLRPDKPLSIQERDTLIRTRYTAGVSQAELARQFGISYQRVHQIVHGRGK